MSTFVKKLSNALLRMPPLQAIHLLGIRGKSAVKISNELAKGAKPCSSLEIASMIESPADFLSREHFAEISPETKRQIAWRLSRRNIPETVENAPIRQGDNEDTISSLNRGNTFCSPISETNPDLVGGKGASLGVLANIPEIMTIDSFSVNSIAFDAFIRHNDLEGMITKLERLSEEWIRLELTKTSENITEQNTAQQTLRERILNCSKKIYDKFLTADIPNSIRNEIISQYRLLSARQGKELSKVAVRSSATAEDLPTASFAGMQETLLNQVGDEAVVNAVRAVWASYMGNYEQDDIGNTAFSDKSVFYRNEQRALILLSEYLGEGLDSLNYEHRKDKVAKRGIDFGEIEERMNRNTVFKHLKVKLAVVVQKMGEAYAAGVVFSVDTKTGAPIIKIEANYGLGETVVAGKASVDNWKVFRHNLRIFDWRLGEKSVQIVPDVAQGIVTIPCPAELRGKLCLTDEIVVDIARQAIVIEEYYQKHKGARFLDMEYVVDKNGRIYFVQARPETLWSRRISQPGLLKVSQLSFDKKQEEKATLIFHNGFGASPGVAVGRVRVCPSLEDAYKQFADDSSMGDILVTTKTTPEWVPVAMGKAGAFITDIGGAFNHAAVVGREFGKPVIVDARQATKDLLPWDGKCVSVNAGNANIYKGRLPVIQRVDEYNLHRPLSFEPQTKPIKFDRVYEEQGLVTKPRHPVRALQKALYLSAFELIKERHEWDYHLVTIDDDRASALRLFFTNWPMGDKEINQRILEHIERNRGSITAAGEHDLDQILMDLVPKEFREFVKGIWRGRYSYINIPFDDLDILTQRIRNMSVAELEKTNTKQERTVKVFIEKCQTARVEPKNLSELFKAYVEMIYHFHLRWTYARAIAHVLDETMKELGLPSEQRANMFTLIQCEGDLESTKWIAETNILSERLANVPSQSRTVKGLANHDADLLRDILKYASLYRLVDIDDMSAAPAVELAVINLAKGVKQGIPGKESVANIQFHFPPEVYNNLDLWRILAVNEIGGRIKDDAHHFQPRGQFLMREQLLTLGKYLVEQRILSEADDIFDRLPEDIIRYAGSYFQQVQRSKT